MCLVSFIPTGNSSFILTSNRDESPKRPVSEIALEYFIGEELIFPKELKGGSWIFACSNQKVVCLLNGGFQKHQHNPPYARSRGLIMKDFFTYPNTIDFFEFIDLFNIEPFTSVIYEQGRLFELVWDGQTKHINELDTSKVHIWSSSTLYTPEIQKQRQKWFTELLDEHEELSPDYIKKIHKSGGKDDAYNGFVMNRENRVCTVSITQVIKGQNKIEMMYEDLLENLTLSSSVKINHLLV